MQRTTATNEDYYKHHRMIHMLAIRYAGKSFGAVDREELFSVGLAVLCEARAEWRPEKKAAFITYLHNRVRNAMINYSRDQMKFLYGRTMNENGSLILTSRCEGLDIKVKSESTIESSLNTKQVVKNLTSEAQAVVEILLSCPHELMDMAKNNAPKSIRGALRRYLRKLGWKQTKIHSTFNEIKMAVKTL